jgi:hypothetical protein
LEFGVFWSDRFRAGIGDQGCQSEQGGERNGDGCRD